MLGELLVTQVEFFARRFDALWEARLKHLIGELVGVRVQEALEGVRIGYGSFDDGLGFLSSHRDSGGISLEPLGSNFRLPLDELDGKSRGLTACGHFFEDDIALVS